MLRRLTASRSRTSVTGLERVRVTALSEIIDTTVDDDSASENRLGSNQRNELILDRADGITSGVSREVAEITNVTGFVGGCTMGLAERVEVAAGRGAAIGIVAKLVHVEAAESVGVIALDIPRDLGGSAFGSLLEGNSAGDARVSANDSN